MASPRPINQRVLVKLARLIDTALDSCPECAAYVELDWYVSPHTVVRPDLLIFCGEVPEKLERKPILIVEVVSPESKLRDEGLKFELYRISGVEYYVLVYPDEKEIRVFELVDREYTEKKDRLFTFEGCEIEIPFEEVFHGLG
jgi:Uma2 family endonuclease